MQNQQTSIIDYMWEEDAYEDQIRILIYEYLYAKVEDEKDWYGKTPIANWESDRFISEWWLAVWIHVNVLSNDLHSLWNTLIEPIWLEKDCLHVVKNVRKALYLLSPQNGCLEYFREFWAEETCIKNK